MLSLQEASLQNLNRKISVRFQPGHHLSLCAVSKPLHHVFRLKLEADFAVDFGSRIGCVAKYIWIFNVFGTEQILSNHGDFPV